MGFVGSAVRLSPFFQSAAFSAEWGKEFRPFGAGRAYLNCMVRANDSSTGTQWMKYGFRQRPERLSPGSQHFRSFWGAWRTLVKFQISSKILCQIIRKVTEN